MTPRACFWSQKPSWALQSGTFGGWRNHPSTSAIEPHRVLGSSKPGITGGHKGVRHSRHCFGSSATNRRSSEHRLGVEERPAWANAGSDPRVASRFTAVERTSASAKTHTPFAGRCGNPKPQDGASFSLRRGEQAVRLRMNAKRISASLAPARTTMRCADAVREGDFLAVEGRRKPLLGALRSRMYERKSVLRARLVDSRF